MDNRECIYDIVRILQKVVETLGNFVNEDENNRDMPIYRDCKLCGGTHSSKYQEHTKDCVIHDMKRLLEDMNLS